MQKEGGILRLISADGKINLSFCNWDVEIVSPYLIPPVYLIKASTNQREKVLAKLYCSEDAEFVLSEIGLAYEQEVRVCYISQIIEKSEKEKHNEKNNHPDKL